MTMKKGESFEQYYKRIGVKPAERIPVTMHKCPDCQAKGIENHLVSHLNGARIERKRGWPKGCNYFACSNCRQPLFVSIESWE